ncbi:MAG: proteobacterial dedicated sortase system response regulator [Gammaproteobacteria bacterium]|nr:proteobacterial dedicated sortase system response regulator [Gammaproteobacteria bacterium]
MTRSIAIVEDEAALRANYRDLLQHQGYRVACYAGRSDAWRAFTERLPDLAILDIGLGDEPEGGFELCRELRARSATLPIIFLTARDSDLDTISGLRLGADDYLTKETSLPHLSARISALFRRIDALRQPADPQQLLIRGGLELDLDRLQASWQGQPLELTVTELWMVHALAAHPGHVRNREQLMQAANILVDSSSVSTHIKRIRRKFEQLDTEFHAIEAVYGAGYRWRQF